MVARSCSDWRRTRAHITRSSTTSRRLGGDERSSCTDFQSALAAFDRRRRRRRHHRECRFNMQFIFPWKILQETRSVRRAFCCIDVGSISLLGRLTDCHRILNSTIMCLLVSSEKRPRYKSANRDQPAAKLELSITVYRHRSRIRILWILIFFKFMNFTEF